MGRRRLWSAGYGERVSYAPAPQRSRTPDWVSAAVWSGGFVALLWVLETVDQVALAGSLDSEGIRPRSEQGLLGILLAPLLHADFAHLVANTLPALVLGYLVLASGVGRGLAVTAVVWAVSGIGVWVVSPTYSVTLGASGLIFGWLVYLLVRGFFTRSAFEIILGITLFLLYGGLLLGVLPGQPGVSWQAHLFGAVGGLLAAVLLAERTGTRTRRAEYP